MTRTEATHKLRRWSSVQSCGSTRDTRSCVPRKGAARTGAVTEGEVRGAEEVEGSPEQAVAKEALWEGVATVEMQIFA